MPLALGGCIGQVVRQLVTPAADGFFIQTRYQGELPVTRAVSRLRNDAYVPAALRLIQSSVPLHSWSLTFQLECFSIPCRGNLYFYGP
jgi:hypothetical protein